MLKSWSPIVITEVTNWYLRSIFVYLRNWQRGLMDVAFFNEFGEGLRVEKKERGNYEIGKEAQNKYNPTSGFLAFCQSPNAVSEIP